MLQFSSDLLVKFRCKIKQPAPSPPLFVNVFEIIEKKQIFPCFALWFALLIFQPCCNTDLREISLVILKNHPKSQFVIFGEFPTNCLLKSSIRCSGALNPCFYVRFYHLHCGINSKCTEVKSNIMRKSDSNSVRITSLAWL